MQDLLIRRQPGLIEAEVDDELVGLHVDNGTCYGFNPSATRIWLLIAEPRTLADLCQALAAEFDVAPDACAGDVRALLAELEKDGLVALEPVETARG